MTITIIVVVLAVIPGIVLIERAQRRIPVNYAKRIQGRRVMGGTSTYIPLKVNGAGVIPIIFASALLYFPAQMAAFFNVDWLTTASNALSSGWLNWVLNAILIVFFCFFYTSMVFNPDQTADNLRKQGGFIPGVRPGQNTVQYIKNVLNRITLPGGIYIAAIAVIPSILFFFIGDALITAFGGTSILIMVGVALDTMSKLESQLKMHHYEGFFK
jgi:preprotein translocase subunit SecY